MGTLSARFMVPKGTTVPWGALKRPPLAWAVCSSLPHAAALDPHEATSAASKGTHSYLEACMQLTKAQIQSMVFGFGCARCEGAGDSYAALLFGGRQFLEMG